MWTGVAKACYDPVNYKYTPTAGLPELREAIVAKSMRDSGLRTTPSQVLVTNGGKHAIITAMMTKLNPGDEVLIPAPYWTTYPEAVYLAGGKPVPVMTSEANGFRVTVDELERVRTSKTTMLVLTSRRSVVGPLRTTSGFSVTRSTNTWCTATPNSPRCRSWHRSWGTAGSS